MACKLCESDRAKYAMMLAMGVRIPRCEGFDRYAMPCSLPTGHRGECCFCNEYSHTHCLAKTSGKRAWDINDAYCA